MKPMNKNTDCIKHKATVFVRVRPKLDAHESILNDLVIESQLPSSRTLVVVPSDDEEEDHENYHQPNHAATAAPKIIQHHKEETFSALNGKLPIHGFSGIFGMEENNKRVYQHSFQNKIETVMRGGTLSLFCYGYTGAGKTHTVLGYNGEAGLFQLAAEELLSRIDRFNSSEKMINEEPVILLASVIDVYNDDVYDLLGGNVKCTLRKNKMGQLSVRGPTRKHEFTEEEAKINGFAFSIVTTSLTTVEIKSIHDLEDIHERVLQYRKVGTSSIHNKSSRSHAIFRLDIVNRSFLDTLSQVEEAESIKPAVQTAYDKKRTFALRHKVMALEEIIEKGQNLMDDMFNRKQESKEEYYEEGRRNSTSPFGGRLLLVDLAGADSDGRDIGSQGQTVEQRKESTAINKSLLALKECIRTLASSSLSTTSSSLNKGGGSLSIPFRNSNLTRLLEEVLTPMPNRESCSVMLVNIGPEESLKPKTINSLRYGQMFSLSSATNSKKNKTGASASSSSRRPSRNLIKNRSKNCKGVER